MSVTPITEVERSELLLRRVPPNQVHFDIENGVARATGSAFRPKSGDLRLSVSRLRMTSPRRLLDLLVAHDIDPSDWRVAILPASVPIDTGFHVVHDPEEDDPGHCHIQSPPMPAKPMSRSAFTRLGRGSRLLSPVEIDADPSSITIDPAA